MDVPMNRLLEEAGGGSGRRLKLSTLIRLRWLAVSGQTAAILVVGALVRLSRCRWARAWR